MKFRRLAIGLVILLGCRGPQQTFTASPGVKAVVAGNNAFALNLYHEVNSGDGNLFFSPFAIYTSLGMTYAGARGQTESEMAVALQFSLQRQDLYLAFRQLLDRLDNVQHERGENLTFANSLWLGKEYHVEKSFLEVLRTNYNGEAYQVNFSDANGVARQANDWVEDKTGRKIKAVVTPGQIIPDTRLFLCSAIYFEGNWQTQFKVEDTIRGPFYVSTNQTVTAPMMSQMSTLKSIYYSDDSNAAQLLEIPYSGGDLSMIILLPSQTDGLSALEQELTATNLNGWLVKLDQANPEKVAVLLPRFSFQQDFDLARQLKSLGLPSLFGMDADLSGMDGTTNLFVADAIHKAVIEVDEAGTRAAAATWMTAATKSQPTTFRADHPFIFLIRDNQSGCILFLGRVMNPLNN